jgi:predicted ArsR family transcriptional regulator
VAYRAGRPARLFERFQKGNDSRGSDHAEWAVEFDTFFSDSGGTTFDKIMVDVTNNTTGYSEGYAIFATEYGTCAKQVYLPLAGS